MSKRTTTCTAAVLLVAGLAFGQDAPPADAKPDSSSAQNKPAENEMNDAIRCVLDAELAPQSGPMVAWDTMAVLMAGYESSEKAGQFVDITEYTHGRDFQPNELPDPHRFGTVFQRT